MWALVPLNNNAWTNNPQRHLFEMLTFCSSRIFQNKFLSKSVVL